MWMVMRRKWMIGFLLLNAFEVLVLTFLVMPAARAADADAAEAVDLSAVRTAIEAESDPELRAVMKEELEALESRGVESLLTDHDRAGSAPELIGPPVEGTGGGGNYLPPAARAELEQIFSQGTGDPSKDGHLREQAEKVMEKYGVERPTFGGGGDDEGRSGGGLEQRGEGFERAMMEHMAPEAREQMERFMSEREMGSHEMSHEGMEREMMEREFGGPSSERSYEAPTHEYEAQTREYEAPTREYEAQTREYEAPTREYEAPTREYEAPTREYETPTREYEAPTREYEAPTMESPTREYDPAEGSGMGPH